MGKEKRKGYTWHMYHDHLLTYCDDYKWRVEDIKFCKPKDEVEERLKRFQFVKGELPSSFDSIRNLSQISRLVEEHKEEINVLHEKECLRCTWNGEELVLKGGRVKRIWNWIKRRIR